ncbi:UPF0175 family protein [Lamprobacter modestohalophilus]|uniref:UPF0175 family protein n=1 Tax=Lamprobacter modestohalophilus TaxID=1064514 RepID=UPI002ADEB464|nr:UPF0175 family protein [Lamprobacter modestohalophilus]MEA1048507.1 UPF0175 family protein [Lamprobacter modestohalophilus]
MLDFDPGALSALRQRPDEFAREVKSAAVVQWYAEGRISQSKASEILGLSRSAFLNELYRRRVPAVQTDMAALCKELACLTS